MIDSSLFLLIMILTLVKLRAPFLEEKKDKDILIVQIYIDDIIFDATNEYLCKDFAKCLQDKFEMSMMRELNFFLRFQIKETKDDIFINQRKYIKDLLKRFGMEHLKIIKEQN